MAKTGASGSSSVPPLRVQRGTQATTNALAVIGVAIAQATPFAVSGWISLNNMVAGDTFVVTEEVRDQDDATYRQYGQPTVLEAQSSPMYQITRKTGQGWRISIQRTAGADRDVTYQFFKEW